MKRQVPLLPDEFEEKIIGFREHREPELPNTFHWSPQKHWKPEEPELDYIV